MKASLVELRKKAEDAVHDMPDGNMKVKAFETILAHLLGMSGTAAPGNSRRGNKVRTRETAPGSGSPKSCGERLLFLKAEGFFKSQRSIADIRVELKKNGWHYPVTSLSGPLQSLVQRRELRREHAEVEEGRKGWKYSNP
jgi:hypothetical protein